VRMFCAIATLAAMALLPAALLRAEDFQDAKLIDIQPYEKTNAPIIAPNNGHPVLISTDQNMMTIAVALNGMTYSANFRQRRDFKSSTLVVGDSILARLDDDNLVLKKPNGKEIKAKLTRRARLEPRP